MKLLRSKYFIPALHILTWTIVVGVPSFFGANQPFLGLSKSFFIVTTIYHIGFFYFNIFFLYPKLLTRKWWWLYIIALAVIVWVSYYIKLSILKLDPDFHLTLANQRVIFFGIIPFLFCSIIFRLIFDRIRFERLEKEARTERLASELKFLRSQISPHFLFNMMTNMVSLARQKSDILEPSLIKLSELLRYMLYDSDNDKITVTSEIEQLENFIDLQQLRFEENVNVRTEIKNESPNCMIEPMLLVPFIENAFKHGIGTQKDPYITVELETEDKKLSFHIANNYTKENISKDKSSGIGLVNVRNRLRLLYPGKYELRIDDQGGVFSVHLNIDLT
jgi:two-component system LytT family sensor kinase